MRLRIGVTILEAEFDLLPPSSPGATFALVLESKNGVGRNPDYFIALEGLLQVAGRANCQIVEALLASRKAMQFPRSERVLRLHYPIQLTSSTDFSQLRRGICRAQASIITAAKTGRGNSHRRLCLELYSARSAQEIFGSTSVY
jgi:hypothetical protein